eukprot:CAMPEP_0197884514 /NCGR_PEP_ID=MMETSP1439-20131203/10937_1 /TAXON_ID=66791 /ORGANISM="Gonyaulax spinifera, Strain CCMP409" /LENGTH=119 /DNA_ID=CAMNT_0043504247 /DNA_START=75 /DNA_END=430 /DNA_ORIENTATION=-
MEAQAEKKALMVSTILTCCSSVISGKMGSETMRGARFSALGIDIAFISVVALLPVDGDWVVDAGADASVVEVLQELVALVRRRGDDVEVPDRHGVCRGRRKLQVTNALQQRGVEVRRLA